MIKAIIFDNNGVLTLSDRENTVSNFAKYFGIDEAELHKVFDKFAEDLDDGSETTLQFYQKIADFFGKSFNEPELRKIHVESYQPKPNMRELVVSLKRDFDVALLTNYGDAFDEANKTVWHHDDIFDPDKQFVSHKLRMRKPNKDIYEYAVNSLGYEFRECIFVDDREANLIPARELGMQTVLFTSPAQCKKALAEIINND
jgi:glucose-1-phosphatase